MSSGTLEIRRETPRAQPWTLAWWRADARWISLIAPIVIFEGHLSYGAMLSKTAFSLMLVGSLLLIACLATPTLRRDLARLRLVEWPAGLFGLTVLAILWSFTPYAPGGPHPVWAYLGEGPGASTLDKSQTLRELLKLIGLASFFGVGAAMGSSDSRARAALQVLLVLGAIFGFWAFLQFAGGALGPDARRLSSSFNNPNTSATLFGVLLVLALGASASRARGLPRERRPIELAPFAGAVLLFSVCLIATASRGGFTAAAIGLVVFALLQTFAGGKWTQTTIALAVGVVATAGLVAYAGDQLVDRLTTTALNSEDRRVIFETHWRAFKGAPWMGYGLGSFDAVNRQWLDAQNLRALWAVRAAHNVYLTWLEETGFIGAIPMFACIASVMALTLRAAVRRSRFTAPLFALLAADVVILAHGATDFALETYSIAAMFSLLLGLQFAASQGSRR